MNLFINGYDFVKMVKGGACILSKYEEKLNSLNVFPVADGDTGTNMKSTFFQAVKNLEKTKSGSIGLLFSSFANDLLLFARGNSGVILSQIFFGVAKQIVNLETACSVDLAKAYLSAVEVAYKAVQNPTEGTILTVFRESSEYASSKINENSSVVDFYGFLYEGAKKSLENTKNILPVLAEADVVDSGGAGYLCIVKGMLNALLGKSFDVSVFENATHETVKENINSFTRDSKLEFGYCTEALLRLTTNKVNPDEFDLQTALNDLNELKGESVVAYKNGDMIKVHVHTFTPGAILTRLQNYGEFLSVKVENMSLSHSETPKQKQLKRKKYSVVAVCSGEGISALFKQMGADVIINGGQTANPSVNDFLQAFKLCNSENIIVLPNNKNVILATLKASELYKDANVHIVESKNLMQGYTALSVINPAITDVETLINSAKNAINSVICGEVTKAVRDADLNGISVKTGQYVAVSNGKMCVACNTANEAVLSLIEELDLDLCEIITLFKGKEVLSEQCYELVETLKQKYEDFEICVYDGGQEIYDYLIAVE